MRIRGLSNGYVVSNGDDDTLGAYYHATREEAAVAAKKLIDRWVKKETS